MSGSPWLLAGGLLLVLARLLPAQTTEPAVPLDVPGIPAEHQMQDQHEPTLYVVVDCSASIAAADSRGSIWQRQQRLVQEILRHWRSTRFVLIAVGESPRWWIADTEATRRSQHQQAGNWMAARIPSGDTRPALGLASALRRMVAGDRLVWITDGNYRSPGSRPVYAELRQVTAENSRQFRIDVVVSSGEPDSWRRLAAFVRANGGRLLATAGGGWPGG